VYPNPSVKFVDGNEITFKCGDSPLGSEKTAVKRQLEIEFSGTAPYTATFEVQHESHSQPVKVYVESQIAKYRLDVGLDVPGRYKVWVSEVSDGSGCKSAFDREVLGCDVHVSDVATISVVSAPSDVCVGDLLTYGILL
jgi:hypothetical protein